MNTKTLLLEVIDCAFDKRSWHGANLTSALKGVKVHEAARSFHYRKSIWQQLLHAAYWKHVILNKLTGTTPFARRGSNWPVLPKERTEETWRADQELLKSEHQALRKAIASLPEKSLDDKTIWLLHSVAAHDIYHAGQIKLLRRLIANRNKTN